ncbi:hypothetical protein CK203_003426 [Vitis vinifera]|uniref:Uncharacterized protein n=1 Tax=Vitis vinifera TaxID=29760 RepID=A0A438K7I4_VITVI|nr:hypothetical protein CK203_003426 [Vitis vinifera]
MDAVLQIFKRSICLGTPFFESLAKKPSTTMDDLFRRANKYSMLEDDVRAATQQVLVVGQASRSGMEISAKLPDRPRPSDQRQEDQTSDGLDPSERTHPKEIIARDVPSTRNMPHNRNMQTPPGHYSHTATPFILSLEIGDFDVRRILVDPGSSTDLVQASVVSHMGHNLSPFNVILGRTWLHYMKAIPSTYHQMVSFLTKDGQIDLYGSQLAARQCYQIARESGTSQEDASLPESNHAHDQ